LDRAVTDYQLIFNFFHMHKFCNPNNSSSEALTHAAFHKQATKASVITTTYGVVIFNCIPVK